MRQKIERCVITISDSISPTSMPYNEFVLYRMNNYPNEKQIMIILFETTINKQVVYPDNLQIYRVGKNLKKFRSLVSEIVNVCRKNGIDFVFHIHEGKSVLFYNLAMKGKYNQKIIYTLHSTYVNYSFHNKLFAWLAAHMCRNVVCVSKTSYKYFPDNLKNRFKGRIVYIQNGVDTDRVEMVLNYYDKLNLNQKFRLIYVARLVSLKRHEMIFDAIKEMDDVELYLIGTGPREEELKRLTLEKGIETKVNWCGALSREDVYKNMIQADLYVSASFYEGLPISVLEAMCCEMPCLVSNIEQHQEIKDICPTLIVSSDSVDEWKKNLIDLKIKNKEELKKIGKENHKGVVEMFSLRQMHANYDKLYEQ